MPKRLSIDLPDPPPPRKPRLRAILMVLLGLALAPLVYEGSALGVARWMAMFGPSRHVETPVLTLLASAGGATLHAISVNVASILQTLFVRPSWVIGFGFAWAVCCSLLLRRR